MGFSIKKIISAFIMPLGFGVLLGLIGLYFLYKDSYKKAKIFLTLSIIVIFFSSYNPIANKSIHILESQYIKPTNIDTNIKYALLLGGDFEKRAYGILEIYAKNKDITVITSGWEGDEKIPEAFRNRDKLINLGIPKENIITQHKPKDTYQEALQIKQTLGEQQFYLVTSAYHMPRAFNLFKNQALNPIAYPIGIEEKETKYIKFANGYEADKTQKAVHEYLGILWASINK